MNCKNAVFALFSIFLCYLCNGQVSDDFSDRNFTENPIWTGDTSLFIVSSNLELQLSGTEAGSAHLSLPCRYSDTLVEWRFTIALDFAPSNNNFSQIYLCSDRLNVKNEPVSGYYLHFGENGSNDAVELYYKNHGNITKIARGINGNIANAFHHNYKITKTQNGHWKIYCDSRRNGDYILECETTHLSNHENNIAFGVYCQYTVSNIRKFRFDNFYFGTPVIDTVKPAVISLLEMQDMKSITVTYNKNVSEESGLYPWNYCINESLFPIYCQFIANDDSRVQIFFADSFNEDEKYRLVITSVTDYNHNKMDDYTADLSFYRIKPHDVLIYEIMAHPLAKMPLSDYEYIELKNRTNRKLHLHKWNIQLGNSVRALPDFVLEEKGYAIVVAKNNIPFLESYSNLVGIQSMSITNSGQRITLFNEENTVIHTVHFSEQWHSEQIKREGGWALEMIDELNPCEGENNWNSSVSPFGGTPGEQNSIAGVNRDNTLPTISGITIEDSLHIILFMSETIITPDSILAKSLSIKPTIEIGSATKIPPDNRAVKIGIAQSLSANVLYTLEITGKVNDCAGLSVSKNSAVSFGIPEDALLSDLVINEVMTNYSGNTNSLYIEIYNRSKKIIDLKQIQIGSGGNLYPEKTVVAMPEGYQLLPQTYFVFCKNKNATLQEYFVPFPERLIEKTDLPSFAKKSGMIHITNLSLERIDYLQYDESLHYEILASTSGVALERINFDVPTENSYNWTSAAATYGYGTPGYKNSQYSEQTDSQDIITVTPEIISPDNDGFNDYTVIRCQFNEENNRLTIRIFNRQGKLVKTLANNILCGSDNFFTWDGATNRGEKASLDMYILKFEYWNNNGNKGCIQKSIGVK
jgi:hypothetical protein